MAEQSIEQSDVIEGNVVTPETTTDVVVGSSDHDSGYVVPRGAIAFGVLMILGYAFYFFMIWSEVIARGGQ